MEAPIAARRLIAVPPALVIALVVVADLALGPSVTVLGLVVAAPLLAASLVGPAGTARYAVAAIATVAVLGLHAGAYQPGPQLGAQVFRLAMIALCGGAAVAASRYRITREQRLTQVTKVAEAAQRAILLPVPDDPGPVQVAVRYTSAASESLIGGDMYGMTVTPFGLRVLVGDVRGKGLDAVRLSSQVLAAFRERACDDADLGDLAQRLDTTVARCADLEDFVTAVLVQLEPCGRVTVVNAGHPAPLLRSGAGVQAVDPPHHHLPLGLDGGPFAATTVELHPGDRLLLLTDGLTEARSCVDGSFLPVGPAGPVAAALRAGHVEGSLDAVLAALLDWSGHVLGDDVALVLLEYAPAPTGGPAPWWPGGVLSAKP